MILLIQKETNFIEDKIIINDISNNIN
jgi:hypothetical protein